MPERETFLYLTTTGRTTGEPRQIEIWFVEHAGRYYLVAEMRERAGWVKNLTATPAVRFSIGTRDDHEAALPTTPAIARPLEDEPDLSRSVCRLMDDKYGWSDGLIVQLDPNPS